MRNPERYRREALARARCEARLAELGAELAAGTPRRHLEPRAELIELLIEQTGSNLYTEDYKQRLAHLRERIAQRPHLHLIRGLS